MLDPRRFNVRILKARLHVDLALLLKKKKKDD